MQEYMSLKYQWLWICFLATLNLSPPVREDLHSWFRPTSIDGLGYVFWNLSSPEQRLIIIPWGLKDGVVCHEVTGYHTLLTLSRKVQGKMMSTYRYRNVGALSIINGGLSILIQRFINKDYWSNITTLTHSGNSSPQCHCEGRQPDRKLHDHP